MDRSFLPAQNSSAMLRRLAKRPFLSQRPLNPRSIASDARSSARYADKQNHTAYKYNVYIYIYIFPIGLNHGCWSPVSATMSNCRPTTTTS